MGNQSRERQSTDRSTATQLIQELAAPHDWNPTSNLPSTPFAHLLLEAATHFVDLPAADFDRVIIQTLDILAARLNMEHVGLSLIDAGLSGAGQPHLEIVRRYVTNGNPLPPVDELAMAFPWYAHQWRQGKTISLPRGAEDLPPEAVAERAYAEAHGLRSMLALPLRIGEQLIGILYFISTTHTYTWPTDDLHALSLFGRVVASAAQRRQIDEVLRRNEEQLSLAIDAADIGIWSWDIEHPAQSYGSDNLSKIHGVTPCPKEKALEIYLSRLSPATRADLETLLARCLQGEVDDFVVENELTWPDDSVHWVEVRGYVLRAADGRPQRITGVLQEITARKVVELQVEQQRLELLRLTRIMAQTEQLGEIGGWEWDIAADAYYWTPEAFRIFGIAPTHHPDFTETLACLTPTSATMFRRAIQRSLDHGDNFDLKLQLNTRSSDTQSNLAEHNTGSSKDKHRDTTIWVRIVGRTEAVEGKTVRIYGSIQDITRRTQIEAQLREAQKNEAIGQLAGGIAHDFNNVLTAINGMSELALLYLNRMSATTEIDRVRNYVGEIQRAGARAAELTRQLLAYSRKQILRPKVLDLRASVMGAQELLRQLLGDNIEFRVVMPPHLALVMADPNQIEQVITNLVINARDAMPHGGTLTIRLQDVTIDAATVRQHMRLVPGNYVLLEVQDTGHGMTPEVQARLFDPFFTTKAVGQGTGLGLATVYGIVKQSGGFIDVDSVFAVGSTFRIYLPRAVHTSQERRTSAATVSGGTESILLVGDDDWARQGYRVALEVKGYRVLDAASGREAIDLCQSYVGQIHLMVVSGLYDMPALAFARQAQLSRPDVRILLLDNLHNGKPVPVVTPDGGVDRALQGYFFLNKPFTLDIFVAKIRSVLDASASIPML